MRMSFHALETDMTIQLSNAAVLRAMRSASRQGFSPYDSHSVQAAKWAKAWSDKARRTRDPS